MSHQFKFEAIGTAWTIDIDAPLTTKETQPLFNLIKARIEVFDHTYSRFRADSLVTQMSQKAGDYQLPPDSEKLLGIYQQLYRLSEGAFTPLVGNLLEEAGYDATYNLQERPLHQLPSWEEVMAYQPEMLTIKQPSMLDFGAGGKGYLIDLLGGLLKEKGLRDFCLDGSGDVLYQNQQGAPLRIGLEHPQNPKQVIGVATIANQSLCASAVNRRQWGRFHHIMDPRTLSSPTQILAVWVTAHTALIADSLATCLFLTEPEKLISQFQFEYLILRADYTVKKSAYFPAELFYAG